MKKSDLKDMMIVVLRNGDRYVVAGDRLCRGTEDIPLTAFTDEMKHIQAYDYDIVKVYDTIEYLPTLKWEREDDLDLPFNGKAVFTGTGQTNNCGYTVGKVYEFVNGKTTDDDGTRRPIGDSGIPILDAIPSASFLTERELKTFGFLMLIE